MQTIADLVDDKKLAILTMPANRRHGREIATMGGVELDEFSPQEVHATVQVPGVTSIRHTMLQATPAGLQWSCTCTGNKKLFCKHLVATALVVRQKSPNKAGE